MIPPTLDVRDWTQETVHEWLQGLQMEQYAPQFAGTYSVLTVENDIDGAAVVLLDDETLRDLGVQAVGHRVTLLSEIYRLKTEFGIPIEEGDWVPRDREIVHSPPPDWLCQIQERGAQKTLTLDERIHALERYLMHMSTGLIHLRENVMELARAAGGDLARRVPAFDPPFEPRSVMIARVEAELGVSTAASEALFGPDSGLFSTEAGEGSDQELEEAHDNSPVPYDRRGSVPASLVAAANTFCLLAPISDAVYVMLQTAGYEPVHAKEDVQVRVDDAAPTLLDMALHQYNIQTNWSEYVLFIHYNQIERYLSFDEKPMYVLQKLRRVHYQPWFSVAHMRSIESPAISAELKMKQMAEQSSLDEKVEVMRMRPVMADPSRLAPDTRVFGVSQWLYLPSMAQGVGLEKLRTAQFMGPAAKASAKPAKKPAYAVAIHPFHSNRKDDLDVLTGDAFIILAKKKGWWVLRRDSLADGRGDIYVRPRTPEESQDGQTEPVIEIWTGWAPAGCLLETTKPLSSILYGHTDTEPTDEQRKKRVALMAGPPSPTDSLRESLTHGPIPLNVVASVGTVATLLLNFTSKEAPLSIKAPATVRVFKRYKYWCYCIVDAPTPVRGWVPGWCRSLSLTQSSRAKR